jgi:hypothetical protein
MAGPNSDTPAATRPSPTKIPPSAVTEVGCQWPSRRRRLATARGRFLEMQKWAQVAEESGSRVWARPRAACHLTPSQWRARHTGATPHSASRNRQTSPRAKSRRWGYHHSPAGRHKSADEMALPSALQSGSTRHGARTGGPIQTAAGVCAIGEATCDGR